MIGKNREIGDRPRFLLKIYTVIKRLLPMTNKVAKIGVMSLENYKNRTIAIAKGE